MHFFKRLEIHGFKSFANKTIIDLLPGITVIVGPNGCGKSNVFDSIRWVLGESRAKSLRGERMDDVIFGGSASVKATGFAKVDLVLNNSQKLLPIDFEEVVVGRSIFRTGETEYRINKSSCRRKDVTGLFLDTGIGTDGYSVMEQGRVSQIINSRPLERRAIFDEAAGIARYKMHKEDAVRRLERTQSDLERLNDLVFEVRKQFGILKRQAGKAARFKTLEMETQRLEGHRIFRHWIDLRMSLTTILEERERLSKNVEKLAQERDRLDTEFTALRVEAERLSNDLENKQTNLYHLLGEISELNSSIAITEQKIRMGLDNAERIRGELETIDENSQKIAELLKNLEDEITKQNEVITILQSDVEVQKTSLDEKKKALEKNEELINSSRKLYSTAKDQRAQAESDFEVAKAMCVRLSQEAQAGEKEVSDLELEVLQAEENLECEKNNLGIIERQLADIRADFTSIATQIIESDSSIKKTVDELDASRKKAHETESRYRALADLQENYEGYFRGVREVMIAGRDGRLSGLCGVVSELFSASSQIELAIEIALGARAQDIVVSSSDDAKNAIRFLKNREQGRATFLALDIIRPRGDDEKISKYKGQSGVVGLATELVEYDPKYEKVAQYLLGGVLIVRDLDVAVGLNKMGLQTKIVTLQGDMVDPHGAMTGGSAKASGLLYRTRQIQELEVQTRDLGNKVKMLESQAERLRNERRSLREKHNSLQDEVTRLTIDVNRCKNQCNSVERYFQERKNILEKLKKRRASLNNDIAMFNKRQDDALQRIGSFDIQLSSLECDLSKIEKISQSDQAVLSEMQSTWHKLLIRQSAERERQNSMVERKDTLRREFISLNELLATRETEKNQAIKQSEELGKELNELKNRNNIKKEECSNLENFVKDATEVKGKLSVMLQEKQDAMARVGRDYNYAVNAYSEQDLKRQEKELLLDNLDQTCSEKFDGLNIHRLITKIVKTHDTGVTRSFSDFADESGDILEEDIEAKALEEAVSKFKEDDEVNNEADEELYDLDELQLQVWLDNLGDEMSLSEKIRHLREKMQKLGAINMTAIEEFKIGSERLVFLQKQLVDLEKANTQLSQTIREIDEESTKMFVSAFEIIKKNFQECYRKLFGGGNVDLVLTNEDGILDCGIDIEARPPGKKNAQISLLSGGEQAMTAIALLFGIFMYKPSPFCILDEIDAPLDDKNIERFKEMVRQFSHTTQFIIITHNKSTMTLANTIYGVTMQERGVSRVVSIKLDDFEDNNSQIRLANV